jgi:hypothetical protein
MGEVDLQEHRHKKKKSYRMKHNTGDESIEECCLHHLFVLEACLSNIFEYKTLLNSPKC